jgi:hypothetical protein
VTWTVQPEGFAQGFGLLQVLRKLELLLLLSQLLVHLRVLLHSFGFYILIFWYILSFKVATFSHFMQYGYYVYDCLLTAPVYLILSLLKLNLSQFCY